MFCRRKKRYGSEKDKRIVKDAILNNKEFVKFALQNSNANYINEIVGRLIRFVIVCNEVYNESELE